MAIEVKDIIEIVLCLLIPPVAVFFHANDCNIHVVVSIILYILGWIPGVIHAIWYCFFRA